MSKSIEVKGKSREEAIEKGLQELGLTIAEAKVEVVTEGSKGLFGFFGSREWVIRVTSTEEEKPLFDTHSLFEDALDNTPRAKKAPKPAAEKPVKSEKTAEKAPKAEKPAEKAPKAEKPAAEKAPKAEKPAKPAAEKAPKAPKPAKPAAEKAPKAEKDPAQPKPKAEKKPAAPVEKKPIVPAEQADPATSAGKAQSFLQELTRLMGVEVSVAVATDEEGNVRVNMEGDGQGILIGRHGETLDALQYLTSLQVNKGRGEYTRVTLDTEGYRARREEALIRLANRMANRAIKTGRRVSLEPMNPYERRVLHSALQGNEAVTTHSEGEEPNRHVVITVNKPARAPKAAKPQEAPAEATEVKNETASENE
ncbi:MAG: protein jag [Clostridia bacterium]|nr:protein jag [Clostridia bacterium]